MSIIIKYLHPWARFHIGNVRENFVMDEPPRKPEKPQANIVGFRINEKRNDVENNEKNLKTCVNKKE